MSEATVQQTTAVQPPRYDEQFQDFLRTFRTEDGKFKYRTRLGQAARQNTRSLVVDFDELVSHNPNMARDVLSKPVEVLDELNRAAWAQLKIEDPEYADDIKKLHVRLRKLLDRTAIRKIGAENVACLLAVDGIIVRSTGVKPLMLKAAFQCRKCNAMTYVDQVGMLMRGPGVCGHCRSRIFELIEKESTYINFQEIRIQERPEDIPAGQLPRTINVKTTEDLVDVARPGDRVTVTGIVKAQQDFIGKKTRLRTFELELDANYIDIVGKEIDIVEITPEEEHQIRELSKDPFLQRKLISSLAPSIYGYGDIKEAVLYLLFGGVHKRLPDGMNIRGEINTLIVGDPGTAKSQLLQYVTRTAPRGLYTSGRGTSAAGLTAAVLRDKNGGMILEAGALVLADKGVACLEENTVVLTNNGLRPIKGLQLGSQVLNYASNSGASFATVKQVISQGSKNTLTMRFYTGTSITCTPDHQLLTNAGWKAAGDLKVGEALKIPAELGAYSIINHHRFEKGMLHGFCLSDVFFNEQSPKNRLGFAVAEKNIDRAKYFTDLIYHHYHVEVHEFKTKKSRELKIRGRSVHFGQTFQYYFSSAQLKQELTLLFHEGLIPFNDKDYCLGFIAGITSTDCCVSHKQGTYGVKHVVEFGIGRKKYRPEWTRHQQENILTLLHSFGVMAVIRRRKVVISSLTSYNRLVELVGSHVVGKNKRKLYFVKASKKISAYDDWLDDDYANWLASIRFNTSATVRLGLHSRIRFAVKRKRVTLSLMETLRSHWKEIANGTPFREEQKNYLLNPITVIAPNMVPKNVYDLTIDGTPNFLVAGSGIVHNCIDEMDKMRPEDRIAIHEALEQHTVSIAKGGIVATLNARAAVLAAANPTMGRYDPYRNITDNINMPVTLLSRFDLVFVMPDVPDKDQDEQMAKHILTLHKTKASPETPPLTTDFLRKYIAFAKHIEPVLSEDASNMLWEYYVKMRTASSSTESPVAITPRQLESLVRLSEARAKLFLRETVTVEDASTVIRLMSLYMQEVGIDTTTGKIDIDVIMTGKPKSLRDKMDIVLGAFSDLEKQLGTVLEDATLYQAVSRKAQITEDEARRLVESLLKDGILYSPKPGHLRRTAGS